jgi:hypothetical protein
VIEIEGFVIVPPLSKWKDKHIEELLHSDSHKSFGKTPQEAWRRIIHPSQYENAGDFSIKIQQWFDRGYRVKNAKITINIS